jgi:hypothetical protein
MDDPGSTPQEAATTAAPAYPSPAEVEVGPRSRRERMRLPLLTAGVVGGLTIALHVRDPHDAGSWGLCPWLAITGQYCPGCGALRAVNDLTNGDVLGAASSNLIFVVMVPVLVLWWLRWTAGAWSAPRPGPENSLPKTQHPGRWIALFTVVMVVFGVLRNLPAGSWLAP